MGRLGTSLQFDAAKEGLLTETLQDPPLREDILDQMRVMAQHGKTVSELVHFVQDRLGVNKSVYLPVLSYLTKAFGVHLLEVLAI